MVYMRVVEETPSREWNNLIFLFPFFSSFYGSHRRLDVTQMGNGEILSGVFFSFLRGPIIYAKKKQKVEISAKRMEVEYQKI